MNIRGVEYEVTSDMHYIPVNRSDATATWDEVLNSEEFKGFVCIVQTDANIDRLMPKDIVVNITEISTKKGDWYPMKELAEVYTEEDGCKYYAIENRAR